jgi:glycosyltransferase involved in cell wall biosynthesis
MRLLFAHDHRFLRGQAGELYSTGCLPASAWDRYLEHFDQLHVIARDEGLIADGVELGRADKPGVSFEFLPNLSSARQLLFRSREVDRQMEQAVRDADAVVARLPSEIGFLAVKHARRLSKPYAVEVVACAWDALFNFGGLSGRLYAPLAFLRTKRAVAQAPQALYVTSSWLQGRYPTKCHAESASNVELEPVGQLALDRRRARLEAIAKGRRPVLGTIASLRTRAKGVQTAIAALSKLRRAGIELDYHLLGAGPAEPWRALAEKAAVADLVHFDGTRSAGEGVAEWLDGVDIYLQPSFQEGLPRSTIEAMSRGAACIGSTCGGIPELLPNDRLHKPGDVARLVECIRRLASDPAAIGEASRADLATARQFDLDRLKGRRHDFFARLRALAEAG